ncbi:acyltransferase [Candidatus Nitrotoga sp. 1052]|uniref:acyltransferase n=1 Tax=Candidatus Nitrotoga sp. 1052 TaxID=2886964 RepID=UPI001EF6A9C8|nr:acyltransferase [Candidatus Nitrotoga sp. 1052]CAH1077442.1 dTDP-4-amino-4,6-dideoxy-D-glucose acyltransferase [Candidatus Nitrotoga sp. 1052]
MSYYLEDELQSLGFRSVGEGVLLSRKASVYGANNISIGNHVRIDDFCVLSAGEGGVLLGDYIHIGVYSSIIGGGAVILEDFINISSRVSIYSSNDDYSGAAMTNPMVPARYTNMQVADVKICKHAIVGSGAVILPGITIGEGVAVGALTLVNQNCNPFGIYTGVPARRTKERKTDLLELERQFRQELEQSSR